MTPEEKRKTVEVLVEKIVFGDPEADITYS
jgi:hypothetical protein